MTNLHYQFSHGKRTPVVVEKTATSEGMPAKEQPLKVEERREPSAKERPAR
jgi:hypothetical protein